MTPYIVALSVVAIALFVKGVSRHRRAWTPQSWRRFVFAFLVSLVPSIGGMLLALKLDQGLQFGQTPGMRVLSVIGMFAVAVFAFGAPFHLLGWFATSNPERQFGRTQSYGGHSPDTR